MQQWAGEVKGYPLDSKIRNLSVRQCVRELRYIFQNTSTAKYLKAKQFITANDEFVRRRIKNASKTDSTDDYWRHMAVIWAQLDGLVAGNAAVCGSQCLSLNEFLFLQAEQDR